MTRFEEGQPKRPDRSQELLKFFELKIEEYKKKKNKLELDIKDILHAIISAESDAERRSLAEEAINIANELVLILDELISFQQDAVVDLRRFPIDKTIIETIEKNIPIFQKEREEELKTITTLKKFSEGRNK